MQIKRKKWTAKEDITDSLLKFREKRKWQLAFRRYILEKNSSFAYAPYFGLPIEKYREWVELQFSNGLGWDNFGLLWQFDHIVPVTYFDFTNEEDRKLCWSFINIRVEMINGNTKTSNRIDILAVKPYFEALFNKTRFQLCQKMINKINDIQASGIVSQPVLETFINMHIEQIEMYATLSPEEFMLLNKGKRLADIFIEREIVKKFG